MTAIEAVKEVQAVFAKAGLDVGPIDGITGGKTRAAWDALTEASKAEWLKRSLKPGAAGEELKATSFADDEDIRRFKQCKAKGHSDIYCFRYGDNGIGYWGDNTAKHQGPMCALPPETMKEIWGSIESAKHKRVLVNYKDKMVTCIVADMMPRRKNIKNGAGIDLNPAAADRLGLKPPFAVRVTVEWNV